MLIDSFLIKKKCYLLVIVRFLKSVSKCSRKCSELFSSFSSFFFGNSVASCFHFILLSKLQHLTMPSEWIVDYLSIQVYNRSGVRKRAANVPVDPTHVAHNLIRFFTFRSALLTVIYTNKSDRKVFSKSLLWAE